jgi:ABC-type proline/glycine betaine transport system substrate-binding protein
MRRLLVLAAVLCTVAVSAAPAHAASGADVRFATYNLSLNRLAQGMLREQLASPGVDDAYRRQARNVAEVIQRAQPDVLLINEFDYDPEAARLFAENFLAVS